MTENPTQTRVTRFYLITFLITWGTQVPAAFAKVGWGGSIEQLMPLMGLGLFGPTVAALIASRREPGGVRALFDRFKQWRTAAGWYVLAIVIPGALLTLGLALYRITTGLDPGPWFNVPSDPPRIAALFVIPFLEEIGWRGYALPRLQARYGALKASLLVGLLWGVWHFPMFVVQEVNLRLLLISPLYFIAGSIVFTWLCNRSGALLPIAVAAHFGAHLDSSMSSIPGNDVPFLVQFAGYVVLAVALVVFDRRAWRSKAEGGLA